MIPLTTAFYNIFALIGLFPSLEIVEKKLPHHLRFKFHYYTYFIINNYLRYDPVSNESALNPGLPTKLDLVAERRRAKAMKV